MGHDAGASLTVQNGADLITAGMFENDGTLTVGAGGIVTATDTATNTGTLNVLANGTLNLHGGSSSGSGSNGGSVVLAAGTTFTAGGSYSQSGSVTVPATATLSLTGAFANFDGTNLRGGSYDILGTFQFKNANVLTNAANLLLDGPSAQIIDQSGNNGLANLTQNGAGAGLTLRNGANLTTAGAFENDGSLTVGGGSTVTISGFDTDTGILSVLAGGTLNLHGGSSSGTVSNAGSVILAAGTTFTVGGSYSQSGSVAVPVTATLSLTGAFANFDGVNLTGGSYDILGTFQFQNANIVNNAATLVLDGPAAQIIDQSGNNGLANFASNGMGAGFTIQNGANLATTGDFSNASSLTVGPNSTFAVAGTYLQTAGSTLLNGGTLAAGVLVDLEGGNLSGSGTLNANVQNAAAIDVGSAGVVGPITITGNYTQTNSGVLSLGIGGYGAGTGYDQLAIGGTATLDGTLNVSLINGFVPQSGDAFQVLTFASASGTFATLNIDPAFLAPQYDLMDVTLVAM